MRVPCGCANSAHALDRLRPRRATGRDSTWASGSVRPSAFSLRIRCCMIWLFSAWKPMRRPVAVICRRRVEQHAVVGRGDVADRLAEEALVADDAGLGHRARAGRRSPGRRRPMIPKSTVGLLLGEPALELDALGRARSGGIVLGMSMTVVTPPITAARRAGAASLPCTRGPARGSGRGRRSRPAGRSDRWRRRSRRRGVPGCQVRQWRRTLPSAMARSALAMAPPLTTVPLVTSRSTRSVIGACGPGDCGSHHGCSAILRCRILILYAAMCLSVRR